jgi:hypothetical protein
MIKDATRQHRNAASVLRLPRSNDEARRRAVLDSPRVVRSPLREAGSTNRNRPTSFVTLSITSHNEGQRTSTKHRRRQITHSV